MASLPHSVSKLTDRYQTTVPAPVREQLALKKGDPIRYCTQSTGRVLIERVSTENDDPALGPFLDLLEADVKAHPERLEAFGGGLRDRLAALVGDMDVDLDAPLSPDDD